MRFFEYESKQLLRSRGLPVGDFSLAGTPAEAVNACEQIGFPVVIKSQVLSGGRMKAGGVEFADDAGQAEAAAARILEVEIGGQRPEQVLIERKSEVAAEYYIGVTYDGSAKLPIVIFSDVGGIDIETVAETQPDRVGRLHFSTLTPFPPFRAKELVSSLGATGRELGALTTIIHRLVDLFLKHELSLAEINPLARLSDGRFAVLDGHVELEDEAVPLQRGMLTELGVPAEPRQGRAPTQFEARGAEIDTSDHRGVAGRIVEFDGDLGLVIGAGGGSLSLFDSVRKWGGKPANYCEIGGNPSVAKVRDLTKLVLSKPGVKKIAVMMSIVSNTRVDIVARGVIKGVVELGLDPAEAIVAFRIPGAWEEEGRKILRKYGVEPYGRSTSLDGAARIAVENASR